MTQQHKQQRRHLLQALASAGLLSTVYPLMPALAKEARPRLVPGQAVGNSDIFDFTIATSRLEIDQQLTSQAITINGTLPAPLLKLKEGREAVLRVHNSLDVDTSIHWHGLLLPYQMDGVPGISFAGIKPGQTFEYRFPVVQNGTYWYHSHSGMQEQLGHYGPLVIEPEAGDRISADQDHVILLSDWTFDDPAQVMRNLKVAEGYYNYDQRTVVDFFNDVETLGWQAAWQKSAMWGQMRMSPRDILDVTGSEYTYLINGKASSANWTGLYKPGDKVRLRFINASAMTFFDVKIPGLAMTVVAADGQPVQPVKTDEFRIGVAETYDVIVEPTAQAYTVFAQSQDRSGFVSATLASRFGLTAPVPPMYPRVERGMEAMGAGHAMHDMMSSDGSHNDMMHKGHHHNEAMTEKGGTLSHGPDNHGPGAAMVVDKPSFRLDEPGVGFEHVSHRVLTYSQLKSHAGWPDKRAPAREIELHLTGNMERYMWSFDGEKFSEVDGPIRFYKDERLRLILVNDTMMDHPIHLHGMWMELENGHGDLRPRKHTIIVKPGERVSALITADAFGDWAFHCHLMYHMKAGMFRVVSVA
ncbi:copper resistance system multicopper oxidase [uncultured Methylophaga sp.]|uniref:copper resistance system multicopper oxidase n=1 Tax=uncultured Methylophaga sp. TaxID=285271 RepID=UPI002620CA7F|nr:copper resistance system multicopper oxidase [uncultured Methylophaga sp.]